MMGGGSRGTIPDDALCPLCAAKLNAATALDDRNGATVATPLSSLVYPQPGDLTVCLYCRAVLVFDEGLRPRIPTPAEQDEAMATPAVRLAIFVATRVQR